MLARAAIGRRSGVLVAVGWLLLTGILFLAVPSLDNVIGSDSTSFLPATAPSVKAFTVMDRDFGSGRAHSLAFIVFTDPAGLNQRDDAFYATVVRRVHRRPHDAAETQDYVSSPRLRSVLTSRDGHAAYLGVGLTGPPGSPLASRQIDWLRQVDRAGRPPGLETHVTGDVASIADFNTAVQRSVSRTTIIGVAVVLFILLLIYRSLLTALVPLVTIGVALAVSRSVVALAGQHGLTVSTYTPSFLTAIVLGAGTDYTVFLVSRYHELMRAGQEPGRAARGAVRRLRGVVIASAATVIIGSSCMALAKLALFKTTGPPLAVAIAVTLVISLSLTPALLAILGRRVGPRQSAGRVSRRWERLATSVAARPGRALLAGVVPLLLLALLYPTIRPSYDESRNQPANADSRVGFRMLQAHFPPGTLLPDYLLVHSDRDLRQPAALAALDQTAAAVAKVPGVTQVRSITRPLGEPLSRASLAGLDTAVAQRLGTASHRVASGRDASHRLATGARQAASGSGNLSQGLARATAGSGRIRHGIGREVHGSLRLAGALDPTVRGARSLRGGAGRLALALGSLHDGAEQAVRGLGTAHTELLADPLCSADAICRRVRSGLGQILAAERDRLLPGLRGAQDGAQRLHRGNAGLLDALRRIRSGVRQARSGLQALNVASARLRTGLASLHDGARKLAGGTQQLAGGTSTLAGTTASLRSGLSHASAFLRTASHQASVAGAAGFYLPPGALGRPRFAAARQIYLSPDNHTARLLVYSRQDPFATASMHRIKGERAAAVLALRRTPLAGSATYDTGTPAIDNDLATESAADFALVALVVLTAVLLILIVMLRSLVAPLYLLASVVLSFAAAMGLTALVWQDVLGTPIDWTVSTLTFIILVAVGADYNILLMSRIREAATGSTRQGVQRALASTGRVITSAGLIFAGSFAALLAAGRINLIETGFAIAAGLLLDTFIVRSLVVPAATALLGERAWWPGRLSSRRPRAAAATGSQDPEPELSGSGRRHGPGDDVPTRSGLAARTRRAYGRDR